MTASEHEPSDRNIYEKLSNEIVLDSNLLESIVDDTAKGVKQINKEVIDELNFAASYKLLSTRMRSLWYWGGFYRFLTSLFTATNFCNGERWARRGTSHEGENDHQIKIRGSSSSLNASKDRHKYKLSLTSTYYMSFWIDTVYRTF